MVWGRRVRNSSNTIQIDSTYKNLTFVQKGTSSFTGIEALLTFSGRTSPVLAVRATGTSRAMVISCAASGGTFTFRVIGTGSFTWYLFDIPPSATSIAAWAHVVRDPSTGAITFRSDLRVMKIVGGGSYFPSSGAAVVVNGLSSSRAYAVMSFGGTRGFAFSVPSGPDDPPQSNYSVVIGQMYFTATELRAENITGGTSGPYPGGAGLPPDYEYAAICYLLDVTNY